MKHSSKKTGKQKFNKLFHFQFQKRNTLKLVPVFALGLQREPTDYMTSSHMLRENIFLSWVSHRPPSKSNWHKLVLELSTPGIHGSVCPNFCFTGTAVASVLSSAVVNQLWTFSLCFLFLFFLLGLVPSCIQLCFIYLFN